MEKDFAPYEEALALKELRFDEPCFGRFYTKPKSKMFGIDEKGRHYQIKNTPKQLYTVGEYFVLNDNVVIIAPTFSQAFRWFREKYKLHYSIDYECSQHDHKWGYNWTIYNYSQVVKTNEEYIESDPFAPVGEWIYQTYEEAELACLKKLIQIVNEQQ